MYAHSMDSFNANPCVSAPMVAVVVLVCHTKTLDVRDAQDDADWREIFRRPC